LPNGWPNEAASTIAGQAKTEGTYDVGGDLVGGSFEGARIG